MTETIQNIVPIVDPHWLQKQSRGMQVHKSYLLDISYALNGYLTEPGKEIVVSKYNSGPYARETVEELATLIDNILTHPKKYLNETQGHGFITERSLLAFKNGLPHTIAGKLTNKKNPIKYIDVIAQSEATKKIFGKTYTAQRIHPSSTLGEIILTKTIFDNENEQYVCNSPLITEIYDVY